jgi:hypothetical protein
VACAVFCGQARYFGALAIERGAHAEQSAEPNVWAHSLPFPQDYDKPEPPRDTLNLLGCKIETVGDKGISIKGASLMESLDIRAKSKEELLEWRHALEIAMTFSTKTIEEHIFETKKIYTEMSEVIQKHVDELQQVEVAVEDSRLGAALQVSFRPNVLCMRCGPRSLQVQLQLSFCNTAPE